MNITSRMMIGPRHRVQPPDPGMYAHTSISTCAPAGSAATCTVERARAGASPNASAYDRVHRCEVAEVGDEHEALGDVGERRTAVAEHRGDVRKRLAGLRLDAVDERCRSRVEPELTRQDDPLAGPHRRRVRTHHLRRTRRRQRLDRHGPAGYAASRRLAPRQPTGRYSSRLVTAVPPAMDGIGC